MKNNFEIAKKQLDIIIKNKKLTEKNYDKKKTLDLANKIFNILRPHLEKNKKLILNWKNFNNDKHKKYILETLDLLIKNFPSKIKPKVYFKDTFDNTTIPNLVGACFFANQNKYANKFLPLLKSILKEENPIFFGFFNDLNDNSCTGQIVHEFTHYLQFTNQSSLSKEVLDECNEYYDTENKEIYYNSIMEVEAIEIGSYINQQIRESILNINNNSNTIN